MKLPHLFLTLAVLSLSGCQTGIFGGYFRVTETDARGDLIAEWITVGRHPHDQEGWRIVALERKAFDPPVRIRFPHGWPTRISAAHVQFTPISRPEWMDHYVESTSGLQTQKPH